MAFKTILVHMDDGKHCERRLAAAAALARVHAAHLVGVCVVARPYIPTYMAAEVSPELYEIQQKRARESADAVAARFRQTADRAGIAAEWRAVEGYAPAILTRHARYADLAVLGQFDPDEEQYEGLAGLVEEVILAAGRPVLVIPYAGRFETLGERVLLAWNASREATRAANDALPILERARQVTVMNVDPQRRPAEDGDVPGADLALHLARHGVKAEASAAFGGDIDVGDVLLSRAADLSADLIVMGAYGRSRLRELVLGGASRHILGHMTVPVLMSH